MPDAVSVVFCTYNRCAMLQEALNSFLQVPVPQGVPVEVLVVDNGSDDATRDVVARLACPSGTTLRYAYEPARGLSNARNRGLREASGAILAFVDDDVLFDAGWLGALVRAFDANPGAGCLGGRTRLAFETQAPRWLTPYLSSVYGVGVNDDEARPMRFPEHPYGLNMAFRRWVFDRVGDFSTKLGRVGATLLSGEETELFARVHEAGIDTIYSPDVVVWHRVPQSRARLSWLLRRHYWGGVSRAVTDALVSDLTARQCMLRSYYEVRRFLAALAPRAVAVNGAHRGPGARVESLARLAQRVGAARKYAALACQRRERPGR